MDKEDDDRVHEDTEDGKKEYEENILDNHVFFSILVF